MTTEKINDLNVFENPNFHIIDFLDYYIDTEISPEYGILLKGEWGSGKTWFIKNYLKKPERKITKVLYVSLYGISSFAEIEDQFFQQLHPILSSKAMSITGKVAKGLLKTSLKIDLDGDGNSDGSINSSIPDINLPDYLKDTNKMILLFDDLERCNLPYNDVLGYINYFVEHQGQKVIILANEEEILRQENNNQKLRYKDIKEKLIGKTFKVSPNIIEALDHFISLVNDIKVQKILNDNIPLILDSYQLTKYDNLRNLKQSIWDFERLYKVIPKQFQSNKDFIINLIKQSIPLAIEIRQGAITPSQIVDVANLNTFSITEKTPEQKEKEAKDPIHITKYKHPFISSYTLIPNEYCWYDFFERGLIEIDSITESLNQSVFFNKQKSEDWVILWGYFNLSDLEFEQVLKTVTEKFFNLEYKNAEIIRHITGVFLSLSKNKLIDKKRSEIAEDSIQILDKLHKKNKLEILSNKNKSIRFNDSYAGLGFSEKDTKEFIRVSKHVNKLEEKIEKNRTEQESKNILELINSNVNELRELLTVSNASVTYHDKPILHYLSVESFYAELTKLSPKDIRSLGYAFKQRYQYHEICLKLKIELKWLKKLKTLLLKKAKPKKGKVSGLTLNQLVEFYINPSIESLSQSIELDQKAKVQSQTKQKNQKDKNK